MRNSLSGYKFGEDEFQLGRPVVGFNWLESTRIKDDINRVRDRELASQEPGFWSLSGYDPTLEAFHDDRISTVMAFQKPYGPEYECESQFIRPILSNLRTISQLPLRGYGQSIRDPLIARKVSPTEKAILTEIESHLIHADLSEVNQGKSDSVDITSFSLNYLPPESNPQHAIHPSPSEGGWIRGGEPTRNLVRELDRARREANLKNSQMLMMDRHH